MKIAHLSAEVSPFAKTGGLGDVVGALPFAQAAAGHDVTIWVPLYREVRDALRARAIETSLACEPFVTSVGPDRFEVGIVSARLAARGQIFFVGCDPLFDRAKIYSASPYGYDDGFVRYPLFVRAALQAATLLDEVPDILHAHDWHAALAPMALAWDRSLAQPFGRTRSVLTIHNLAYQGMYGETAFPFLDLPIETKGETMIGGAVNFLKGAIVAADAVTAVSPNYAWEITTPEGGFGLDGILRTRLTDLFGIVNGIDTDVWDPSSDAMLPARYSADNLEGKKVCRRALLARAQMDPSDPGLVVGMIGRMVEQKGFDLLFPSLPRLVEAGIRFVLLGSGEKGLETLAADAARRNPGRVFAHIGFDEAFAHLIEAGADAFLMPSRFEPCGLNQLYSLRYGTLPIVRKVGGLVDTVVGYDGNNRAEATGFMFEAPSPSALANGVLSAQRCHGDAALWALMVQNAMNQDFSWARSARRYTEVYKSLLDQGPR